MQERLRFVVRLLEGEDMSDRCREFSISRKTGYKIFHRYKEDGLEVLTDRSRRRCAMQSVAGASYGDGRLALRSSGFPRSLPTPGIP